MASGIILIQLWYRFSVSSDTKWHNSEGTSVNLFLDKSEKRKREGTFFEPSEIYTLNSYTSFKNKLINVILQ